jgi:hypothetical protein
MWRLLVGPGALVLGVAVAAGAALGLAEEPADGSLVDASVEGTLDRVVTEEDGLILKTKDGRLLGWELPAPVIEEAAKHEKGTPMWVIYRKLDPETEAVTALGFPGVATVPVYVNATGYSVVLRTGPAVDGKCQADGAPAGTAQKLGPGIATEVLSACWCCAPEGDTCAPSNHSGKGRIVLAQCFKSGPDWRDGQN